MSICPTPDYLVLADECKDFYYEIENEMEMKRAQTDVEMAMEGENNQAVKKETVKVVNPGNFSQDYSFSVIYPFIDMVNPS
jgi:hypothetical protein